MKIDIDGLSEGELIELNHKVVARLRFLAEMRSHAAMLDFRIGEKVRFRPDGHPEQTGTSTKYNRRTVTAITGGGQHWNVSPGFLKSPPRPSKEPRAAHSCRFPSVRAADKGPIREPARPEPEPASNDAT
jgi:hypothetical protein